MPAITFKAKVEPIRNMDDTLAYELIKAPAIERRHCDMDAFRRHPKFGSYANSDLFKNLISRQLKLAEVGTHLRLDRLPACVSVDRSGFLASVTIELA